MAPAATRSFQFNKNSTRIASVSSVGDNKLQNGGAMPSKVSCENLFSSDAVRQKDFGLLIISNSRAKTLSSVHAYFEVFWRETTLTSLSRCACTVHVAAGMIMCCNRTLAFFLCISLCLPLVGRPTV
eukprot:scaffold18382_cov57-Attheya_sp.AAC.3